MTPTPADADRKRAAKAGRRVLAQSLPPGMIRWIDRTAKHHNSPEDVHALAGSLAAIALAMEQAYARAGTEVRDLILRLHEFLSGNAAPPATSPFAGFEPFAPWMRRQVEGPQEGLPIRLILVQWIDVASERLTLRRYHRHDLPAQHAKVLILRPAQCLGLMATSPEETAGETGAPRQGSPADLALVLLRFVDLLDAERLGLQGKNRVVGYGGAEIGGFYGISENVQPPDAEMLTAMHRDLRASALSLAQDPATDTIFRPLLSEIAEVIQEKISTGDWPASFRWKSPDERKSSPALWRRLFFRS